MQKLYEAVIGEKGRDYYLKRFESFDQQGPGLKAGWNWSALFAGGVWSLYRKMYGWFFAWWGVLILANLADKSGGGFGIILFAPLFGFAVYANSLYHNSVKRKIAMAQFEIKDESKLLEHLRRKGGVNSWVVWVSIGVPVISILAAIFIPMLAGR